jgi:cytochrome c oxidase subunit 2
MLEPRTVLTGQWIAYTLYVLAIMSLIGWFAYSVTRGQESRAVRPRTFYTYVLILVVLGVSFHLLTRATLPWKELDLESATVKVDRTFDIEVADHTFKLPDSKLVIKKGEVVRFNVVSRDLTYGFGLFRPDNTMLFQMQVIPGHDNKIAWRFTEAGTFTIRSTEYSGPKGIDMVLKDAVQVTE